MSRVRIIGGAWKRRLITVPLAKGLRPTPDAVRETLFNWLGQGLTGLNCLDLFAGSGALGFEAASRGAAHVTLVENDARAYAQLEANARALVGDGAECKDAGLELLRTDALKFVSRPTPYHGRYDVLFLDPPYRQGWIERIEPWLPGLLAPGALIYAEAEHALARIGTWHCVREGRAGQVFYHLLEAQ